MGCDIGPQAMLKPLELETWRHQFLTIKLIVVSLPLYQSKFPNHGSVRLCLDYHFDCITLRLQKSHGRNKHTLSRFMRVLSLNE